MALNIKKISEAKDPALTPQSEEAKKAMAMAAAQQAGTSQATAPGAQKEEESAVISEVEPEERINAVVEWFRARKKKIIGTTAAVVAAVVLWEGGNFGYNVYLVTQANAAIERGNYVEAVEHLTAHRRRAPGNTDTALKLLHALLRTANADSAGALVEEMLADGQLKEEEPLYHYFRALVAVVGKDEDNIHDNVSQALFRQTDFWPAVYLSALHEFFDKRDAEPATKKLENALATVDAEAEEEHRGEMNYLRRLFFDRPPAAIDNPPLPFVQLQESPPIENRLGFSFPLNSFNNVYYVPTNDSRILRENLSVKENFALLVALIAAAEKDADKTKRFLTRLDEGSKSVLYGYLNGYVSAVSGDYKGAEAIYRELTSAPGALTPHAELMLANAMWSLSEGRPKLADLSAMYEFVLQKNADDTVALNNLALLKIYEDDLKTARETLEKGYEIDSNSTHLAMNLAFLNVADGNLEEATEQFYALAQGGPDSELISGTLAEILKKQQKYGEAVKLLNKIKADNPDSVEPYLDIVAVYRDRERPRLAIQEINKGLEKFADSPVLLGELLLEYASSGDVNGFVAVETRIEQANIPRDDYRILLAEAIINKDAEASDRQFSKLLRELAGDPAVIARIETYRVENLITRRKYGEAAALIKQILQRRGDDAVMLALRYRVDTQGGAYDNNEKALLVREMKELLAKYKYMPPGARTDLARAMVQISAPEEAVDIIFGLGSARFDIEEALGILDDAYAMIESPEVLAELQEKIGDTGRERKPDKDAPKVIAGGKDADKRIIDQLNKAVAAEDYETAVKLYTRILDDNISQRAPALTYQNRGAAYLVLKKYREAASDFDKALTYDDLSKTKRSAILANYGAALARLGDLNGSKEKLQEALSLNATNLQALSLLAQVQAGAKELADAAVTYERLLELSPKATRASQNLAKLYSSLKQPDKAIRTLQKALRHAPNNNSLHRQIAEAFLAIGESEKAQEHMNFITN